MKLKLGIQCQEKHEEVYRYNRELKPLVVKSINITDREHYQRLAAENPGVELVFRYVPNGPWDNPETDGRKWAEHLFGLVGHIPEITLGEGHGIDACCSQEIDHRVRFGAHRLPQVPVLQ